MNVFIFLINPRLKALYFRNCVQFSLKYQGCTKNLLLKSYPIIETLSREQKEIFQMHFSIIRVLFEKSKVNFPFMEQ